MVQVFTVVVPNPSEMTGVVPPVERIGYEPETAVTPPAAVVVAMTFPFGSTARTVPAGTARPEILRFVVEAVVAYKVPLTV